MKEDNKLGCLNSDKMKKIGVVVALIAGGICFGVGCASGDTPDIVEIVKEELSLEPTPSPTIEGAVPYSELKDTRPAVPFIPPTHTPGPCPSFDAEIGGVHLDSISSDYFFENDPTIPLSSTLALSGSTVAQHREFCLYVMQTSCDSSGVKKVLELSGLHSGDECQYSYGVAISPQEFPDMQYGDMFYVFAGPCASPELEETARYWSGLSDPEQGSVWGASHARLCSPEFFNEDEKGACYVLPCDNPDNALSQEDLDAILNPVSE